MTRDEIENLIKAKVLAHDADTGLYDTGLQYVVVDIVNNGNGDEITFQWFESMRTVDDLVNA
jgi:hypothetical protein